MSALLFVDVEGGVLGLELPDKDLLAVNAIPVVPLCEAYRESSFKMSACEYAAPITLSLLAELSLGGADGRLLQKGEDDLSMRQSRRGPASRYIQRTLSSLRRSIGISTDGRA